MNSSRPEEALAQQREQVRSATQCVTTQPVVVFRSRSDVLTGRIGFAPVERPAPLRTRGRRRSLFFLLEVNVRLLAVSGTTRGYDAVLQGYAYEILDRDGSEIIAYHWHPLGLSSVTHPHLHLSNQIRPIELGRSQAPLPLADMHLATGVVPLAHVVRMLIEEFGVEPLRDDWDAVLPRS
jgi:hypothetical protein